MTGESNALFLSRSIRVHILSRDDRFHDRIVSELDRIMAAGSNCTRSSSADISTPPTPITAEEEILLLIAYADNPGIESYFEYVRTLRKKYALVFSLFILNESLCRRLKDFRDESVIHEIHPDRVIETGDITEILYRDLKILKSMENLVSPRSSGRDTMSQSSDVFEIRELRYALDNMIQGVLVTNTSFQVIYMNESVAYQLGHSRREMDSLDIFSVLGVEDIADMKSSMDIDLKRSDGTVFPANIKYNQFLDDDFEAVGNIFIVTDLRERLEAEEKARRMAKAYGVVEMAGAAAHEINQPLQVISMITEMLIMQAEESDPNTQSFNEIRDLCQRISKITSNIQKIAHHGSFSTKDYLPGETIVDIYSVDDGNGENS